MPPRVEKYFVIACIGLVLTVEGCSSTPARVAIYDGPERADEELAIVTKTPNDPLQQLKLFTEQSHMSLVAVDNKSSKSRAGFESVTLLPGDHTLAVTFSGTRGKFWPTVIRSSQPVLISLNAKAGHRYSLSFTRTETNWSPLLIDETNQQQIYAPGNELKNGEQRLTYTGFSLLPPDDGGWIFRAQQSQFVALRKSGADPDESYVINAHATPLPKFDSYEEFVGFAKTAMQEIELNRFTRVTQEVRAVTIKSQACQEVKNVDEDHGAVKTNKRTDPMILETYSLVCPHPQKKIAVVVAYSHRHFAGQADPEVPHKAKKLFQTVDFSDF